MNLYEETTETLNTNDLSWDDVVWVGSNDGTVKYELTNLSEIFNVEYDNGYGRNEIAMDLVVVGLDWWLSRKEYDGREWWEFNSIPLLDIEPKTTTVSPKTYYYGLSEFLQKENRK